MKQYLPPQIFDTIQRHLIRVGDVAQEGWEAGESEEDTLTGHLGGQLQRRWSRSILIDGDRWRWRVTYKKFRGRGPRAFEKATGADGIVQIEIDLLDQAESVTKGILFQAKKGNIRRDKDLREQVQDMESLAPNGSAVFLYGPDRYRAIEGQTYLNELRTDARILRDKVSGLGSFLGNEFLPCNSGIQGMYYDALRRNLIIPTATGSPRVLRVDLHHRISVDVTKE